MSGFQHVDRNVPAQPFQPYPAYKDSGVEWLGEIPVHWEAKRLKLAGGHGQSRGTDRQVLRRGALRDSRRRAAWRAAQAAGLLTIRRSRSAANARQARMSSRASCGKSARIWSSRIPDAR